MGGSPTVTQQAMLEEAAGLVVWCRAQRVELLQGGKFDIGPYTTAVNGCVGCSSTSNSMPSCTMSRRPSKTTSPGRPESAPQTLKRRADGEVPRKKKPASNFRKRRAAQQAAKVSLRNDTPPPASTRAEPITFEDFVADPEAARPLARRSGEVARRTRDLRHGSRRPVHAQPTRPRHAQGSAGSHFDLRGRAGDGS